MSGRIDPALRPAIELALSVARDGELEQPPLPAPPRLRPYLSFARMPPAALDAARRVIDDDDAFRARVAAVASEDAVGPVGWSWLTRAEGWADTLAVRAADLEQSSELQRAARRDRDLQRRLTQAAEAAERADAQRRQAVADLERMREEVVETRRARRDLQRALERAEAEVVRVGEERTEAVRQLKQTEAQLALRAAEARDLRKELQRTRSELVRARDITPDPPGTDPGELDRAALGQAVAAASAAADQLARALAAASSSLGVGPAPGRRGAVEGGGRPVHARRRPLRMPAGVFDDTADAVEFLARAPAAVFLVDGYNLSKTGWPGLALPTQRERLVDGLVNLRARTGVAVDVVFDGVDDGDLAARIAPGAVRVRFTPARTQADDLILQLVEEYPADVPVTVVSSDKRVRDGARKRGANTLPAGLVVDALR